MRRFEVRCCCNPEILLGYFFTDAYLKGVRSITMPVSDMHVNAAWEDEPETTAPVQPFRKITLDFATVSLPGMGDYVALKAKDVPLRMLRKLRGFQENPDAERLLSEAKSNTKE